MHLLRREVNHWYQLDLNWLERVVERRLRGLPDGFELVRPGEDELALIDELPDLRIPEAILRHRMGSTFWLLVDGGRPAFACWTSSGRIPVFSAAEDWLELPAGVVAIESMMTAPAYRGRGLAPRVLMRIGDFYAPRGVSSLVAKVADANAPSRRALAKVGFEQVARMRLARVGPFRSVRLERAGTAPPGWLSDALAGGEAALAPDATAEPAAEPAAPAPKARPRTAARARN